MARIYPVCFAGKGMNYYANMQGGTHFVCLLGNLTRDILKDPPQTAAGGWSY